MNVAPLIIGCLLAGLWVGFCIHGAWNASNKEQALRACAQEHDVYACHYEAVPTQQEEPSE